MRIIDIQDVRVTATIEPAMLIGIEGREHDE
jgi:hypothetical protein